MRKKCRAFIIAAGILLAMLSIGGCSNMNEELMQTSEQVLKDKYGENFKAYEIEKLDSGSFYAWLRPEKHTEISVKALMDPDGSGNMDDYILKCICHEESEKASWAMKEYNGDYYIHTDNIINAVNETDPRLTAEEYLAAHPGDRLDISVFVEKSNADMKELYESMIKIKNGSGISRGSVCLFIVDDGELAKVQNEIEIYDDMFSFRLDEILNNSKHNSLSFSDKTELSYEAFMEGMKQ